MGFRLLHLRWPRPLRFTAQCLALIALLYGGAQLFVQRSSVRDSLRAQIASALEDRLGEVELGPDVRVDALFRVQFGPLTIPGPQPADAPLLRIRTIRVRPDLVALLRRGRPAPASIRLYGVQLEIPERPGTLEQALERLGAARARRAPASADAPGSAGPTLRLRDMTVAFGIGGHRVTVGPIQANVFRRDEPGGRTIASANLRLPGSGQASISLARDPQGWHLSARMDGLDARALPPELASLADSWRGGTLSATMAGDAPPALERAQARLSVNAAALRLGGAAVGSEPVGPLDLRVACDLAWSAADRRLRVAQARLELPGGGALAARAGLELREGLPFALELRADGLDYLHTVSALPAALSLPPEAPHPTGTLDARVALEGPLLSPSRWRIDAALDLSRMREAARREAPVALRGPFLHRVHPEHEQPQRSFVVGPENRDFVELGSLPRFVVRAVTASEDAGFFGHAGFDFEELRNAAVEGAQAGRVVRGGSTITQQLAKNLFLSREKTLARKLREALLAVGLEATVPKQRLMEIYLNIAEWGPGVFGIGPAARHWFGKDARELTPREAAFLATVIPNPVRYHYMWNRGAPSEAWQQRVDELLRTMNGQGTLSDEELLVALEEPLAFANGASPSPAADWQETPDPAGANAGEGEDGGLYVR